VIDPSSHTTRVKASPKRYVILSAAKDLSQQGVMEEVLRCAQDDIAGVGCNICCPLALLIGGPRCYCLVTGIRKFRSTVSFGSVDTGASRHSQRIMSGMIAPPNLWPWVLMPQA